MTKGSNFVRALLVCTVLESICAFLAGASAFADQLVKDQNGSVFMEEVADPAPKGQVIRGESGSVFMEEQPGPKKKAPAPKVPPIDFSSLGVPVDPKGRIVPLIQSEPGGVLRNSSRIEVEYTPPAVYVPYYSPFMAPYSIPQSTPYGVIPRTVYSNPLYGYFPVPLGLPRYFTSSSDDPPGSFNYQNSGTFYNYPPVFPGPYYGAGYPFNRLSPGGMFSPFGPTSPFTTVAPFGGSPFSYYPSFGPSFGAGLPFAGGAPFWAGPGSSVWSPRWRAPWSSPWNSPLGGSFYIHQVTQFQQQGTITPIFPKNLDD